MLKTDAAASKATTEQQARLAYVYVRQSSLGQVTQHRESTDLQYQLVTRAVQLGWPRERVRVIDEDLGKSGASAADRLGFQHLMAEVGLGRVGLVLSFDASRLARNNCDWYQLLDLSGIFGTLIADSERVYDPNLYTDRLLLGLSGMMSEAELHPWPGPSATQAPAAFRGLEQGQARRTEKAPACGASPAAKW